MPPYEVHVTKGPKLGLVVPLTAGKSLSIGRAPANDICLVDPAVSSFHARLEMQGEAAVLTDLKSKNGTFLNGAQLSGASAVKPGDAVEMGGSTLLLKPAAGAAPPSTGPAAAARPTMPVGARVPTPVPGIFGGTPRYSTPASGFSAVSGVKLSDDSGSPVFASIDTNKSMAIDPKMIKSALAKYSKAEKNLATLHAVGASLAHAHETAIFFPRLLDNIFDVVSADRGAIFLKEGDRLVAQVTRAAEGQAGEMTVSQTILRRCMEEGVSLLTSDAAADDRFKAGVSVIMQQIRSAMCVPLRGRSQVFGVIYVDSKIARGAFIDDDLELLTTIAVQAGIAVENARLATEAAKAERMAAIGLVVSGLAHDIKNYMMALKGGDFILDAIMKGMPSPEAQSAWNTLKTTHKNISDLVMDMLSYSKQREPEWANMDVNQSCAEATALMKDRAAQKGIVFEQELDYAIGPFYFDPKNISRCIMNLVSNAVDATPEGGGKRILLRTSLEETGGDGTVCVRVQDQGSGIPVEARDKVFDLLFSTKGSKGTGLGLALTRKIIEEHGGTVSFETELGAGTTFLLRLPRRKKRPVVGQKAS
jgi:two-component system NtrC family sensor kinase